MKRVAVDAEHSRIRDYIIDRIAWLLCEGDGREWAGSSSERQAIYRGMAAHLLDNMPVNFLDTMREWVRLEGWPEPATGERD